MTKAERDLLLAVAAFLACWNEPGNIPEASKIAGLPWQAGMLVQGDILAMMRRVTAETDGAQ